MHIILPVAEIKRSHQPWVALLTNLLQLRCKPQVVTPIGEICHAPAFTAGYNHDLRGFFPIDRGHRLDSGCIVGLNRVSVNIKQHLKLRVFF